MSQPIESIVDFAANLGKRMLMSGANLERVTLTIESVLTSYGLCEISVHPLSTCLMIAAETQDGVYAHRQVTVPFFAIHLERLRRLNRLSYDVCREKPDPAGLMAMLDEASKVKEYNYGIVMLGQMLGAGCLCLIFGGGWPEVAVTVGLDAILFLLMQLLSAPGLNKIITNTLVMIIMTGFAIGATRCHLAENFSVIIISLTLLVIPGIPLVNAVRNVFCGNEMNGILQVFKVFLESISMMVGIYIGIFLFGAGMAF